MRIKKFNDFGQRVLVVDFRVPKQTRLQFVIPDLGFDVTVVEWNQFTPNALINASHVVLSGSFMTIHDSTEKFVKRFGCLKETNIPILGICFGHEVLGVLYGANARPNSSGLVEGHKDIDVIKKDGLFEGCDEKITVWENHSDHITLPEEFDLLATSESCEVEAMKHKHKHVYGTQFHPESSLETGERILMNFLSIK